MADKHTLGPWAIGTPGPNGCFTVGYRGLMTAMVAHSINHPDQESTARANARLIAAAPELLAALIACRDELAVILRRHNERDENDGSWRYDGQTISEADAVILKARGEQ